MRIIAGTARGRLIDAPKGMDTRPTLDAVREAVFGMLQFDVPNSRVLDLFSGSGAMGLEAASRGAKTVLCNDHSRECVALIRANAQKLGLDGVVETMQRDYADCIRELSALDRMFDIVFLDAPYADGTAERAATILLEKSMLSENGRIVLEHAFDKPPHVSQALADVVKTRKYGKCAVTILKGTVNV